MFTPKLNTPRSRYQNLGSAGSGVKTRNRSSAFTPQKSFATPTGTNASLGTSLLQTSRVYEESGQHRLESYGQALPILVAEVLAVKDKHTELSVKISPTGWAWMVYNRRLLVWMFKSTLPGKTPPCHELSLCQTGLSHKAELVTIIPHTTGGGATAACLAVSPEGAVRYWANVAHESSFIEISSELKGEECTAVAVMQTNQCIISTSTSSLLLVCLPSAQSGLQCRALRIPQGVLKGISRRMSSLFFGSGTSPSVSESFHQLSAGEMLDEATVAFYLLCGSALQKWAVCGDQERMLYQCNVEQFVSDCLSHEVWHQDGAHLPNMKTWLLDMEVTRDGVLVLAAGMNPDVSNSIHYCMGELHTAGVDPPRSFLSFSVVPFTNIYTEDDENQLLEYRMLLPDPSSARVFLYQKTSILCTSVTSTQPVFDKLEFYAGGDKIVGAGQHGGAAVFFSSLRGLITVKTVSPVMESSIGESITEAASKLESSVGVMVTDDKITELSISEHETDRLKAAFLQYCRGNTTEAQHVMDKLSSPDQPESTDVDSHLDRIVIRFSEEMLDDFPASDPRWAESHQSVGSSVSLILIYQLEDKLKVHEHYIQFLKNIGVWWRLSYLTVRATIMRTAHVLCEHAEKLVAARTLRELHTQYQDIVDQAVYAVLEMRGESVPSSGLTAADIFYRQVSRFDEIIAALVDIEERKITSDLSPRDMVTLVATVNTVIGGLIIDAIQYRQSKAEVYQSASELTHPDQQYMPWTAYDGPQGVRTVLIKQQSVTVAKAIPEAQDSQERGTLFQQLLELTSTILDSYRTQLDMMKMISDHPTQRYLDLLRRYEEQRTKLIEPFVKHRQYERAAALAEKYEDFMILIQICEDTNNQDRLHRYMTQFETKGFADFVFKWYLDKGKRGKLMALSSHPQLNSFLQRRENRIMSWLYDIDTKNFLNAHQTLFELGIDEKASASKKKTLLSLSKLAALATEDPPESIHNNLEAIADEQDLLLQQEQLPDDVIESLGLELDKMHVYTPKELIQLLIGEFNIHADEFHFKKALDLLSYINKTDDDYETFVAQIWCQAILRDDWSAINPDSHLEECRDTVFFKTVELVHSTGMDLKDYLPTADVILNNELLADFRENTNFQFLMKACFEQIFRVLKAP